MKQSTKAKFIIIGSGFGGMMTAIRLRQKGEKDIIILERDCDVGGVWRDNRYPGCACDVESHLYSISFAPNPHWSTVFAKQPEIYAYLKHCAEKFNLLQLIRFQHNVQRMDWDTTNGVWIIQTNKGEFRARMVVGAFGALSDPSIPHFKGIEKFKGQAFHSANWPSSLNLKDKRVAVIGTGASAIQFIPEIQPQVKHLYIFQRTPPWIIPRLDGPISNTKKKMYRQIPLLQKANRFKIYLQREYMVLGFTNPKMMKKTQEEALTHMHKDIKDPNLRQKLTPNYMIGCKRILLSNNYYPALAKPNVDVNTNGIGQIEEHAVIDEKGNRAEVDIIIYGTGFKVTNTPLAHHIYGIGGHSLAQEWNGSPKAYLGTMVSGFPNLFILQGPNTGLGHSSVVFMMEAQIMHMQKVIKYMRAKYVDVMQPTRQAQQRFVDETSKAIQQTVWSLGGCKSWYIDETGRNSTIWPSFTFTYRRLASKFKAEDYEGHLAGITSMNPTSLLHLAREKTSKVEVF